MKKKKILFIGAGASYGAREKNDTKLPLGNNLVSWLLEHEECFSSELFHGHQETIRKAYKKIKNCAEKNYEQLIKISTLEERLSLQKLIQIAFINHNDANGQTNLGFNNRIDSYDELIRKKKISAKDWLVISLNYDCLFEKALRRQSIDFYYPFAPEVQNTTESSKLNIFKPHGSINFMSQANYSERGVVTKLTTSNGHFIIENPTVYSIKSDENIFIESRDYYSHKLRPVMANYTVGKNADINHMTLEEIRAKCLQIIKKCTDVLTIGVKPIIEPLEDPFVSKFFEHNFLNMTYVSPCAEDVETMKNKYPNGYICKQTFDEYLKNLLVEPEI